jgi:hypothetical protein
VSCPDWNALSAHRRERHGVEPEGWSAALAHLDGGCQLCRRQALAADPTLVFRRLAAVPATAMTETQERAEVDAVLQAVTAMRAASRLESLEPRRRASSAWRRWPLAAALLLAGLSLPSNHTGPGRPEAAVLREGRIAAAAPEAFPPMAETRQVDLGEPVVEGVNLPKARVYHMSGEGLSVVMVVDESIDI